MLCKEIGRLGMQPSFRQEHARIFSSHMEMGDKGSSSQMSPPALPRSPRMRPRCQIRPGTGRVLSRSQSSLPRSGSCFSRGSLAREWVVEEMEAWGMGLVEEVGLGWQWLGRAQQAGLFSGLDPRRGSARWPRSKGMEQNLWDASVSIREAICPRRMWEDISGAWAQLLSTAENSFFLGRCLP